MQAVDTLHTLEFLLEGSVEYKLPFSKKSFLGHLTASVESDNGEKGLFFFVDIGHHVSSFPEGRFGRGLCDSLIC